MNTSDKSKTADKLLGLMIITGFTLLVMSLPLGLGSSLEDHYEFHSDWLWAIIFGVAMTAATGIIFHG